MHLKGTFEIENTTDIAQTQLPSLHYNKMMAALDATMNMRHGMENPFTEASKMGPIEDMRFDVSAMGGAGFEPATSTWPALR